MGAGRYVQREPLPDSGRRRRARMGVDLRRQSMRVKGLGYSTNEGGLVENPLRCRWRLFWPPAK